MKLWTIRTSSPRLAARRAEKAERGPSVGSDRDRAHEADREMVGSLLPEFAEEAQ